MVGGGTEGWLDLCKSSLYMRTVPNQIKSNQTQIQIRFANSVTTIDGRAARSSVSHHGSSERVLVRENELVVRFLALFGTLIRIYL